MGLKKFTDLEMTQFGILECERSIEHFQLQVDNFKRQKSFLELELKRLKNHEGKSKLGIQLEDERFFLGLTKKDLCKLACISIPAYHGLCIMVNCQ